MISKRIKQLRKERGMTQAELGSKLGVIKQTISSWETGVSNPNNETLAIMAKFFGVSVDYLLGTEASNNQLSSDTGIKDSFDKRKYGFFFDDLLKNIFISRLKKSLTEKELSIDEFSEIVSFDTQRCSAYLKGEYEPSLEDLIEISKILNVSTDYLLGQIPETTNPETKILNTFIKLNEDNQDIIIGKAKELLKEQRYDEFAVTDEPLRKTGTDSLVK